MKRFSLTCLTVLMAACFSEDGIDLGTPATFIKFFSDGYNNEAVAMEETSDKGYIILMNSTIQDSEAKIPRNKICLIKIDPFGAETWREYYPAIGLDETAGRWVAHSLTLLQDGGYLVIGESINAQKSDMLTFKVDQDGGNIVQKILTYDITSPNINFSFSTIGQAAIETKATDPTNGNILFLASSQNPKGKMVVGELNVTSLDTVWTISRGEDIVSTLTNRLFYNVGGDGLIYWGGTVIKTSGERSDIRFTKNPINTIPSGDNNIGDPSIAEAANDMCLIGNAFAFVGSIDSTAAGNNKDIYFYRGANDNRTYVTEFANSSEFQDSNNDKNEEANSISPTKDGGFIILATIDTYTGVIGRGNTDIVLMKVNAFGDYEWSVNYGSLDADIGKVVRQSSDGGYIALATARLAGTRTLMLVKTDKTGDVD